MKEVVLGLGGNIGDVKETIQLAITKIHETIGDVKLKSSLYQTEAWGVKNQPDFINMVVLVETDELPIEVLNLCLLIEKELGRDREGKKKWSERVIDIDVLFYQDEIINSPELVIPHPYIQERNFVLFPLVEILPNRIHPLLKQSFLELKNTTSDMQNIFRLDRKI